MYGNFRKPTGVVIFSLFLSFKAVNAGAQQESPELTPTPIPVTPTSSMSSGAREDFLEAFVFSGGAEEIFPAGGDIARITRFELVPIGFEDGKSAAGFSLGWGQMRFKSDSFADAVLTDGWQLDIGIVGRRYFTEPKSFLSPYLSGGIFGQISFWDYRTPVIANGDVLNSDAIFGGGGFVGLGLALARKEHFGVYAEARLGIVLYDCATIQGYYNDLLEDFGYVSLRVGASLRF